MLRQLRVGIIQLVLVSHIPHLSQLSLRAISPSVRMFVLGAALSGPRGASYCGAGRSEVLVRGYRRGGWESDPSTCRSAVFQVTGVFYGVASRWYPGRISQTHGPFNDPAPISLSTTRKLNATNSMTTMTTFEYRYWHRRSTIGSGGGRPAGGFHMRVRLWG